VAIYNQSLWPGLWHLACLACLRSFALFSVFSFYPLNRTEVLSN
jgi:hypothetical protein